MLPCIFEHAVEEESCAEWQHVGFVCMHKIFCTSSSTLFTCWYCSVGISITWYDQPEKDGDCFAHKYVSIVLQDVSILGSIWYLPHSILWYNIFSAKVPKSTPYYPQYWLKLQCIALLLAGKKWEASYLRCCFSWLSVWLRPGELQRRSLQLKQQVTV